MNIKLFFFSSVTAQIFIEKISEIIKRFLCLLHSLPFRNFGFHTQVTQARVCSVQWTLKRDKGLPKLRDIRRERERRHKIQNIVYRDEKLQFNLLFNFCIFRHDSQVISHLSGIYLIRRKCKALKQSISCAHKYIS